MADNNIDSPFHRATESALDKKIRSVKERFVGILRPLILEDVRIKTANITHTPLSIYLSFSIITNPGESSSREIRLWYDIDKHEFCEPKCWFVGFQFGDGNMLDCGNELKNIVQGIMTKCYFVSQMPGFGTTRGENWLDCSDSLEIIVKNECERHHKLTVERIEKERRIREEKQKKDADFLHSILSGFEYSM